MSLADRLKKLDAKKLEQRASKELPTTDKAAKAMLSNKSTSSVQAPQHNRPLQNLQTQALTMADNSGEFHVPTGSLRQPHSTTKAVTETVVKKAEESLQEKLARLKGEKSKTEVPAQPNRQERIANVLDQIDSQKPKLISEGGEQHVAPTTGIDFYATPKDAVAEELGKALDGIVLVEEEPKKEETTLERIRREQAEKKAAKGTIKVPMNPQSVPVQPRPDMIVCDDPMPEPKGETALERIRREQAEKASKAAAPAQSMLKHSPALAIAKKVEEAKPSIFTKPTDGYEELEEVATKGKPIATGTTGSKSSALSQLSTALKTSKTVPSPSKVQSSTSTTSKVPLAERLAAIKASKEKPKHEEHHLPIKAVVDAVRDVDQPIEMPKVEVLEGTYQAAQEVLQETAVNRGTADNRAMVVLNERQKAAVERAAEGSSFCLVGPAGTGKTTTVREVLRRLRDDGLVSKTADFKVQGGGSSENRIGNQWSVACVAFTRTAANNIRDSICADADLEDFRWSCQTIHNLLEYCPEEAEVWDEKIGDYKVSTRFMPKRDEHAKIEIDILIIEESSMVDLMLSERLMRALLEKCIVIYLGDINQLPPVFGLPILAYALHRLPVIELTEVYRQNMGPVLNNAHRILNGEMPKVEKSEAGAFNLYHEFKTEAGQVSLKSHDKDRGTPVSVGQAKCASLYSNMFKIMFESGAYDPEQDMILMPWNKRGLGTIEFNYDLAQFIGDSRDAVVHEIIAGFTKFYIAEGDRVVVQKQAGVVTKIIGNGDYVGRQPQPAGNDLSRYGSRIIGRAGSDIDIDAQDDYAGFDLAKMEDQSVEELKRAASHVVEVQLDDGAVVEVRNAGQFNGDDFSLGYCITGHKSQGMEWRKVWIIAHRETATTVTREWLYTTVTRAKKECAILGHADTIKKALARQRIKGSTIAEKIECFTGAVDNLEEIRILPTGEIRKFDSEIAEEERQNANAGV